MKSVANFSRASLLSNGTMAATSKSEVAGLLTATQRPLNTLSKPSSGICTLRQRIRDVNETLGEKKPTLNTRVEGQ
jgi:hypothetical protein